MKKVFDVIVDIFTTLFVAVWMAVCMIVTYVVVIPMASIFGSLMMKQKLSETWLELHKTFISRMGED